MTVGRAAQFADLRENTVQKTCLVAKHERNNVVRVRNNTIFGE